MPAVLLQVTYLMFQKRKTNPNKSDEKAEVDTAGRQARKEERSSIRTSSKLETLTHYVTNLGYTSYSAPNFLCRHFSAAVPSLSC